MTPSLRIALDDLGLERIAVVYPGSKRVVIAPGVEAVPVRDIWRGGVFGNAARQCPTACQSLR